MSEPLDPQLVAEARSFRESAVQSDGPPPNPNAFNLRQGASTDRPSVDLGTAFAAFEEATTNGFIRREITLPGVKTEDGRPFAVPSDYHFTAAEIEERTARRNAILTNISRMGAKRLVDAYGTMAATAERLTETLEYVDAELAKMEPYSGDDLGEIADADTSTYAERARRLWDSRNDAARQLRTLAEDLHNFNEYRKNEHANFDAGLEMIAQFPELEARLVGNLHGDGAIEEVPDPGKIPTVDISRANRLASLSAKKAQTVLATFRRLEERDAIVSRIGDHLANRLADQMARAGASREVTERMRPQ